MFPFLTNRPQFKLQIIKASDEDSWTEQLSYHIHTIGGPKPPDFGLGVMGIFMKYYYML